VDAEGTAPHKGDDQQKDSEPVDRIQGAALQKLGSGQDEQEAETGEGVLDHAEHSDAPGPHGTG
jgi:hypothetical protein